MQDHATTPPKACTKCGVVKPLSEFYQRTQPTTRTTHRAHCKACIAEKDALRTRPVPVRSVVRMCKACGADFLATAQDIKRGRALYCSTRCYHANRPRRGIEARFWPKVDKAGPVQSHCPWLGPCWVWTGSTYPDGYGALLGTDRKERAHRISWKIHFGPIPDDLGVLHHCDNPPCVRPDHLFTGTRHDNMRDMTAKGRNVTHGQRGSHATRPLWSQP